MLQASRTQAQTWQVPPGALRVPWFLEISTGQPGCTGASGDTYLSVGQWAGSCQGCLRSERVGGRMGGFLEREACIPGWEQPGGPILPLPGWLHPICSHLPSLIRDWFRRAGFHLPSLEDSPR